MHKRPEKKKSLVPRPKNFSKAIKDATDKIKAVEQNLSSRSGKTSPFAGRHSGRLSIFNNKSKSPLNQVNSAIFAFKEGDNSPKQGDGSPKVEIGSPGPLEETFRVHEVGSDGNQSYRGIDIIEGNFNIGSQATLENQPNHTNSSILSQGEEQSARYQSIPINEDELMKDGEETILIDQSTQPYVNYTRQGLRSLEVNLISLNIIDLNLSWNHYDMIPPEIGQICVNLQALDISHNQIKSLDNLPSTLTSLNISYNILKHLTGIELACEQLQTIDVSNNQLKQVNEVECCSQLTTLMLSENQISTIEFDLTQVKLEYLDLRNNLIRDFEWTKPHEKSANVKHNLNLKLNPLEGLKYLYIAGNEIESILEPIYMMNRLPQIEELDLSENHFTQQFSAMEVDARHVLLSLGSFNYKQDQSDQKGKGKFKPKREPSRSREVKLCTHLKHLNQIPITPADLQMAQSMKIKLELQLHQLKYKILNETLPEAKLKQQLNTTKIRNLGKSNIPALSNSKSSQKLGPKKNTASIHSLSTYKNRPHQSSSHKFSGSKSISRPLSKARENRKIEKCAMANKRASLGTGLKPKRNEYVKVIRKGPETQSFIDSSQPLPSKKHSNFLKTCTKLGGKKELISETEPGDIYQTEEKVFRNYRDVREMKKQKGKQAWSNAQSVERKSKRDSELGVGSHRFMQTCQTQDLQENTQPYEDDTHDSGELTFPTEHTTGIPQIGNGMLGNFSNYRDFEQNIKTQDDKQTPYCKKQKLGHSQILKPSNIKITKSTSDFKKNSSRKKYLKHGNDKPNYGYLGNLPPTSPKTAKKSSQKKSQPRPYPVTTVTTLTPKVDTKVVHPSLTPMLGGEKAKKPSLIINKNQIKDMPTRNQSQDNIFSTIQTAKGVKEDGKEVKELKDRVGQLEMIVRMLAGKVMENPEDVDNLMLGVKQTSGDERNSEQKLERYRSKGKERVQMAIKTYLARKRVSTMTQEHSLPGPKLPSATASPHTPRCGEQQILDHLKSLGQTSTSKLPKQPKSSQRQGRDGNEFNPKPSNYAQTPIKTQIRTVKKKEIINFYSYHEVNNEQQI